MTRVTKSWREKDAKNICESGRKGATASNEKQEQYLVELQQAKASINTAAAHANDTETLKNSDRETKSVLVPTE